MGKSRHFLQVFRLFFVFEAEAVVKEAAADADGNCQPVGAGIVCRGCRCPAGGSLSSPSWYSPPLGEEFDAGGQDAEQVFKLFGVFGGNVKGTHDAEELVWRNDACLMLAVTRIEPARNVGCFGFRRRLRLVFFAGKITGNADDAGGKRAVLKRVRFRVVPVVCFGSWSAPWQERKDCNRVK